MADSEQSTDGMSRGKQRDSFAAGVQSDGAFQAPSEWTPLLSSSTARSNGQKDEEVTEESKDEVGTLLLPSRLHGKLKNGLQVGHAKVKRIGKAAFPSYRRYDVEGGDSEDDVTTKRISLYSTLSLIVLAVLLGAIVLVLLSDHRKHSTGPYFRPTRQASLDSSGTTVLSKDPTSTTTLSWPNPPFPTGLPRNPAYLAKGKSGGVATENEECSKIGIDILKAGGSSVDAAIAGTLCIGTVNMFSSGIGGGGFMTVRMPPTSSKHSSSRVFSIDFRETVPAAGNATMFGTDILKGLFGGLSVGVPGELKGMEEAHKRWGRLPWSDLVMPSANLAAGWKVGKELSRRIKWLGDFMVNSTDWTDIFAPNGTFLEEGDFIQRKNLSQTLKTIASLGADAFYSPKSPIAVAIIEKIRREGGIMTLKDLKNYRVRVYDSLEGTYRGKKVYTTGAPTSGSALLHMLNLIEGYDLHLRQDRLLNLHRIVEVMKFGFAARTRIGDPLTPEDVDRMSKIPTKEYAESTKRRITDDVTHDPFYYGPVFDVPTDHGTTHVSVIDKDGMAVSLTSTINLVWGSRVLDPVTGIIMNDELGDFSLPGAPNAFGLYPSPYNYPAAGKRPLSSITPVIMEHEDGSVFLAVGGSGGSRIFPAVFQTILNHMDRGMNISQAVEEPRVHDQLFPMETSIESTFEAQGLRSLKEKGHNVTTFDINLGVAEVQAVAVSLDGSVTAASDSRKNGIAAAY